ncbi:MAG: radical SAM/SPASM domain-containing protein [Nitrospinales bacterium]
MYQFYGRLSEQFPSQIIVDATEQCNLACTHCPHPRFKLSSHYSGRHLDPVLNGKMVDEVREFGKNITQYIRYTANGEPLLHPGIFDMLDYAGKNSGTPVCLTSNGTALTESNIEKLVAAEIHLIDVSLDAFEEETYHTIRYPGHLPSVRKKVLNLIELREKHASALKVVVSYVEQPGNQNETSDFERFWRDHGADYVVVRRLHSSAGANPDIASELKKDPSSEPRRPCLYPWERITLNPKGFLAFCPTDWVHGSLIADYRETSIHETWKSRFYEQLREAHLCNRFGDHPFCGQCPDWKLTRWPEEGRSYANMITEFFHEE